MELYWILIGILCICQYFITMILMEHRNTVEKQYFILNQTYSA